MSGIGEQQGLRGSGRVVSVDVGLETERAGGWDYQLSVAWSDGTTTDHALGLAWADHDYWSGGAVPPSVVIGAVARVAGEALGPEDLPDRCDASNLRRMVPGFDDLVREGLSSPPTPPGA